MDAHTHQQLRSRLQLQSQQSAPPLAPDWVGAAPPVQGSDQTQRLAQTVQALKQRSLQVTQAAPGAPLADLPAPSPADIALYQQRLTAMAERINALSQQQQQAIADMQHAQAQLQRLWPHHYPHQSPPQLNWADACLAQAGQDGAGTWWVGYRALVPPPDAAETEAHYLAHHLRQRQDVPGSRSAQLTRGPQAVGARGGLATLLQEPLARAQSLVGAGWQGVQAWLAQEGAVGSPWGGLGWVDVVLWVAGGVVARLGLNGLLAVFPGLWTVAVALITGLTAFALYQATLAPRLRFGLAYRVFLALGGLILAGRL